MAQTLTELGVVADHPEPTSTRSPRATRTGCSCRSRRRPRCAPASSCSAAPRPVRPGHHQQPRRGPDRPAAGQPARRRDARARGGDRVSQRLLLRPGARPAAGSRGPLPARVGHGHRERDAGRDAGRGHTTIRPAAQEPEVDDLIAFLQKMGAEVERTYPDTIEIDGKKRLRGAEHRVIPDRIEAGTFVVAGAVTGGRLTLDERARRPSGGVRRDRRAGRRRRRPRDGHDRGRRLRARRRRLPSGRYRDRGVPGLATDLQPPTAVLLTQAKGNSHVHETIFEDRLEWISASPRMGATVEIVDSHRAVIHGRRALRGRRGRDRRPARRRLADPRRARGGRHDHDPRCAPRSPGL